jgi:hypothetical protein
MRFRALVVGLLSGALCGCSGGDGHSYAPVAGVVRINGTPAANIQLRFNPLSSGREAPVPSGGLTDAEGKYSLVTLSTTNSRRGASVGKHQVMLFRPDAGGRETLPAEVNQKSVLTFDVPGGGTDSADFDVELTAAGKQRNQ